METKKDFRAEFEKELRKAIFPQEKVIESVIAHSFILFTVKSLQELNMDVKDYKETIEAISKEEISLYQMSFVLNNLPGVSAKDLGLTINTYTDLMLEVAEMGESWNEIMKPIQDKLVSEMNREAANAVPKNGKNVIPQKR